MLAKKNSGYRQIPLADIGSPIQIVLSTPDDSECEEDTFDKVSDITIESGNSLSLQVEEVDNISIIFTTYSTLLKDLGKQQQYH
ncbi:hypothetical protein TNIN_304341 [Trichonephila inaurata madagascariensis]|uniref:Uncharacterized protein n=1 Tax=Trichonephila inaurata madagascariensis TaxID=2747483 RepID=A0A8X6KE54_9ARAC|nr:hypothetical protein TNIN_304341 [Trichonephila inaurata madagascariensis]